MLALSLTTPITANNETTIKRHDPKSLFTHETTLTQVNQPPGLLLVITFTSFYLAAKSTISW